MHTSSDATNLESVMGLLRRRGLWGLLCVVVALAAAFGYSRHQTKKYTATASIIFNSQQLSQLVAGLQTPLSGQAEQNSNVKLLQVGDMAARTASALGAGLSAAAVAESIGVSERGETSVVGESSIVDVSATTVSPRRSAAIANTYAAAFVAEQQQRNRAYFQGALALVRRELANMPAVQRNGTAGAALESRVQALSLLANLRYGGVQVAEQASVPSSPSTPNTSRNLLIGAFLGLLAGAALMLALDRADGRVGEAEELAGIHGSALLGVIPAAEKGAAACFGRGLDERFSLILARMRAYNDPDPRSVILASAEEGPESENLAWGLAGAAAASGSRVLVIELPSARTGVAQSTPARNGQRPGMTSGAVGPRVSDLVAPVALARDGYPEVVSVDAIRAGRLTSGCSASASNERNLARLLEQAREEYELILISAPALTSLPEAYVVLAWADGAIVVSNIKRAHRAREYELHESMLHSGVRLLGVVADRGAGAAPGGLQQPEDALGDAAPAGVPVPVGAGNVSEA